MNDLQKELTALKEKVADLESRILFPNEPVAKWQPKGGNWSIDSAGDEFNYGSSSDPSRLFGTERATQAQAERAAVEMRRFNRLLALRDELCGDDVVDWGIKTEKFVIYHNHQQGQWKWARYETRQDVTVHFSDVESAHEACRMLNSGEVEL